MLIDGGYLSWLFGSDPNGIRTWNSSRFRFRGDLILMDSPSDEGPLWREALFPEYRIRRRQRDRPERERVSHFRRILRADPVLTTVYSPGLEADDLLAVYWLKEHRGEEVIAVDKDYLQVPGLGGCLRDLRDHLPGTKVGWREARWRESLPKWAKNLDPLMIQVLAGDRSDSIPRLLRPRDWETLEQILGSPEPYHVMYHLWGDDLIRNLNLLLLPCVTLRKEYPLSPEVLLELVETRSYWNPEGFEFPQLVEDEDESIL